MNNHTPSASFTRMMRVLAEVSIAPALFLPFYQAFLHGGRRAVDITPRVAAYMAVHMLGASCVLLATCGVVAIYLRYGPPPAKPRLRCLTPTGTPSNPSYQNP